jgi:hypothetical protein
MASIFTTSLTESCTRSRSDELPGTGAQGGGKSLVLAQRSA